MADLWNIMKKMKLISITEWSEIKGRERESKKASGIHGKPL